MKALGCSTNGNHALENNDSEGEGDEGDPDANKIDDDSNKEGEDDIRERDDSIEHVELSFGDVQFLHEGTLQSLGVIECVHVGEHDHGEQEEHQKADGATAVGYFVADDAPGSGGDHGRISVLILIIIYLPDCQHLWNINLLKMSL